MSLLNSLILIKTYFLVLLLSMIYMVDHKYISPFSLEGIALLFKLSLYIGLAEMVYILVWSILEIIKKWKEKISQKD